MHWSTLEQMNQDRDRNRMAEGTRRPLLRQAQASQSQPEQRHPVKPGPVKRLLAVAFAAVARR
jgi:hypothetical protein